ncbi:pimeloyl-ACP methyl ester carboxylesterase [Microbacterium amylolyticum]|uniref:Pimeloyl-ACP methyl ester carboxylesterase n=2 Tax=Microbacterium amylolyticum TaxID=936337 RepID=A0ABS4ZIT1_9MICO|nr:pimeloyl-ACP methyl ester carboxylesterase [Microbacterium amylolyticum]
MATSPRDITNSAPAGRIHGLVVHGIGIRHHGEFAEQTVDRIAEHLGTSNGRWQETACTDACTGFEPGHRHLNGVDGDELVLDPVTWFDEIREPSRWRATWWLLRTLFVLCAVHLLVNALVLRDLPRGRLRDLARSVWRALRAMVWMLALGSAALALVVPLTLAVLLIPWARILVADALGWTSDPETRQAVIDRVHARAKQAPADRTVLIGHSQGGAIASNAARGLDPARTTLVTIGSGQALLAPIRASVHVGPWSFAALIAAILVYVAVAAYVIRTIALTAGTLASSGAVALLDAGSAMWAAALNLEVAGHHINHAAETMLAALTSSFDALTPDLLLLAFCVPAVAVVMLVYAATVASFSDDVRALTRVRLAGVDICATFDPVSHPMTVLGAPERLHRITQSASIADHVRYFDNRVDVMAEVERHLSGVAPTPMLRAARREQVAAVRTDRVLRGSAAFIAFLAVAAASPIAPVWAGLAAATVVYALGTVAKGRRWKKRQHVSPERLAARSRPHLTWIDAVICASSAAVMFGSILTPARTTLPGLAALAFVLLTVAVVTALGAGRTTRWWTASGLAASAIVWAAQATAVGLANAVGFTAIAVAAAVLQFRNMRRR